MKEYEAVEYMLLRNTIEGIPINDLKALLTLKKDDKYNNYTYKNLLPGKGIAYRVKKGSPTSDRSKIILIKCVNNYYDLSNISSSDDRNYSKDSCDDIKNMLRNVDYSSIDEDNSIAFFDSFINNNCVECHKKCLSLLDANELKKL